MSKKVAKTKNDKNIDLDDIIEMDIPVSKDSTTSNNEFFKNEFFLYDDINLNSVNKILKAIKAAENTWKDFLLEFTEILESATPKPIKIYINSNGGDVFAAIPLIDAICNSKIPIETYVEGIAASAASLISLCGHKRFITKNSFMLIHELRSGIEGTYSDIIEEKSNCDKLMKVIKNLYLDKTNGKLEKKTLNKILKKDMLLSSQECLDLGLVDKIL